MSIHKIKLDIVELEKKNFHVFVNFTINNANCRLLLDTGASKTVMDDNRILRLIEPNKVKTNESKSVGLGVAEMETKIATLAHWQSGKFKIKQFKVAVLPLSHVNQTYNLLGVESIDGVLGSDFLMKYKAVIDYTKSLLKLKK
ncbi:MAG: retroviral-like aspartic protease family protein [Bacteroidia bacterium]|jgi:predicted aspartyl protease|nr:retroviral-like aspartic protease family protein [Bacteroidia bacterium]